MPFPFQAQPILTPRMPEGPCGKLVCKQLVEMAALQPDVEPVVVHSCCCHACAHAIGVLLKLTGKTDAPKLEPSPLRMPPQPPDRVRRYSE